MGGEDREKMQLIDKQARLFGVINIIDSLVLLFVLCLMPGLWFGYKIFTKPTPTPTLTIQLDKAEYEQEQAEQKAENDKLSNQIKRFLKEHKRARKWFR